MELVWSILLYKSFKKVFIWGWIWFEASCFTDPSRKASFEAGSGLKLFPLQILKETLHLRPELGWSILLNNSLKKVFIWGWIWFEASYSTDTLRKASFEAVSGLKLLPLQILKEALHLRLELVWSILLYKSFKKVFIWGWIRWIQLQKTSHQSIWLASLTWTSIWAVSIRNPIVKLECLLDPILPAQNQCFWTSNHLQPQMKRFSRI